MKYPADSLGAYFDRVQQRNPAYLGLLSSGTDEEFENAFIVLLDGAVRHLEASKKNFSPLGEDGLTGVLAGALSIPGILIVHREANSNGHVDLMIEAVGCIPARIKLGEAKIYKGPKYHMEGMSQLLGRYTTGREMAGLVISYVRQADIKGITVNLRAVLDRELPEGQIGPSKDVTLKWSFETEHRHGSGEVVCLAHIGCNLGP
jgi:hypothetical protein